MELGKQKIKKKSKSIEEYFVTPAVFGLILVTGIVINASTSNEERQQRAVNSQLEEVFSKYDTNRDGFISRQEYRKYLED